MRDWHITDDQLAAFGGGTLDPVAASSVETHLVACDACRSVLRQHAADVEDAAIRRERIWASIGDRIDRPTRMWPGRGWLQATVGAPSLFVATAALVVALISVPVLGSLGDPRAAVAVLFALAPLAPVLGTALAFRADTDPAGELAMACPLVSLRLVLMRAGVVLGVATPVGVAASALLPVPFTLVIGWLLPGVGLCSIVLAGAARFEPTRLAAVLAAGWASAVAVAFAGTRNLRLEAALEQLFVNQRLTQTVFATLTVMAAGFVFVRRADVRPWSTS